MSLARPYGHINNFQSSNYAGKLACTLLNPRTKLKLFMRQIRILISRFFYVPISPTFCGQYIFTVMKPNCLFDNNYSETFDLNSFQMVLNNDTHIMTSISNLMTSPRASVHVTSAIGYLKIFISYNFIR